MNSKKIIQESIDYIENNLKADISLKEFVDMTGYSYVHFCRLFKNFIGISVGEYINQRKLLNAVYEISGADKNIDIALSYGFESYSGFYKAFKKEFGYSPSAFIKLNKCNRKPFRINIMKEKEIMISKNTIKKLLTKWNIEAKQICNIYNENTNNQIPNAYCVNEKYVLKISANLGQIKRNIKMAKLLYNQGISTFEIVKTTDSKDYIKYGELYFIVTKKIEGHQLKCADIFDNPNLAVTVGKNIAKLHLALKKFDQKICEEKDIYSDAVNNTLPDIKDKLNLDEEFICDYTTHFKAINSKLEKQIIHRDINPSNMIFNKNEFMGFVDFDLCEINVRIFDICYCATAILSECFSNSIIDKNKWFDILNNISTGYNTIAPLSKEEINSIPYIIYSIQIVCFAYFSKYDKYAQLEKTNTLMLKWIIDNEHKIRNLF